MQNNYNNETLVYAGFFVRLGAYLIDRLYLLIFGVLYRILLGVLGAVAQTDLFTRNLLFTYSITAIGLYVIRVMYFTLCTVSTGRTLGKRAMNLKVVMEDGSDLTWINIIIRESVGRFLSSVILCIGYLMIGVDDKKRGLHDRICDTCVVYEKRIKVVQEMKTPVAQETPKSAAPAGVTSVETDTMDMPETIETPIAPEQRGAWVVSRKKSVSENTEREIKEGDPQKDDETRGF